MINNKKLNSPLTELFVIGRKFNIPIVFIAQSYFKVPKEFRLNTTNIFIMKIPKRKLQQTAINHSSDLDFKDFMKTYKNVLQKSILFELMVQLYHQIIL